ncbi:MAG: Mov34/MPN/PAD-1 family protein [Acidimicrobiales bacterium]
MLLLTRSIWQRVVAHCLDGFPLEACGLLAGRPLPGGEGAGPDVTRAGPDGMAARPDATGVELICTGAEVVEAYPARNAAASARLYVVEPLDLLHADREAEAAGLSLVGVWHSHTHTDAYPSPTDVEQAPDPTWHYVLVSLRDTEPVLRSYRIIGQDIFEEDVLLRS